MAGLWIPPATLTPHLGERAAPTLHFIDLRDGADAGATAKARKSDFMSPGIEADALQDVLDNAVAAERTG